MLVPLTSSMYIAGELASTKSVLVDVGTGYFVQKKIPDAKKYLNGKVDMLRDQLENVQRTLIAKRSDLETVTQLFNDKAARIKQQQQQQVCTPSDGGCEGGSPHPHPHPHHSLIHMKQMEKLNKMGGAK